MKKVIFKEKVNTVTTAVLHDDKIYAAYVGETGHGDGDDHIILITLIGDLYRTVWMFPERLQNHRYEHESLTTIIEVLLSNGYEVFQFENETELARWMIEPSG
jgi:hypothetical protein